MNKKGQFFFLAVIVIAVMVAGLFTITSTTTSKNPLETVKSEITTEREYFLDYIVNEQKSPEETKALFKDFSQTFVEKIGNDKTTVFLISLNSELIIIGNKFSEDMLTISSGLTEKIIGASIFDETIPLDPSGFKVTLNENTIFFPKTEKNLNYIVNYKYADEVYIING